MPLTLYVESGTYAICRLPATARIPAWATDAGLEVPPTSGRGAGPDGADAPPVVPAVPAVTSVVRSRTELSIVVPAAAVPEGVQVEGPWCSLVVDGTLDFGLTGILAGLAAPLARAAVSIFAISSYDTDRILVPADDLDDAVAALRDAGYVVHPPASDASGASSG